MLSALKDETEKNHQTASFRLQFLNGWKMFEFIGIENYSEIDMCHAFNSGNGTRWRGIIKFQEMSWFLLKTFNLILSAYLSFYRSRNIEELSNIIPYISSEIKWWSRVLLSIAAFIRSLLGQMKCVWKNCSFSDNSIGVSYK